MSQFELFAGGLGASLGAGGFIMLPVAAISGAALIGVSRSRFLAVLLSAVVVFPVAALLREPWYQAVPSGVSAPRFVLPSVALMLIGVNMWRVRESKPPSLLVSVLLGAIVGGIWARLWPGTPGPVLSVALGSFDASAPLGSLWIYTQGFALVLGLVAGLKWLAWRRRWVKSGQRVGAAGMFFLGLLVLMGAYHRLVLWLHQVWPWPNLG